MVSRELRAYLKKLGSKGGKKAAAALTPEQRTERARKAVQAREAKRKQEAKRKSKGDK